MRLSVVVLFLAAACSSAVAQAPATDERDGAAGAEDAGHGGPPPDGNVPREAGPRDAATPDASPVRDASPEAGPFACVDEASFPASIALGEASAAAEVELLPGVRELLIVSDSGGAGAALALRLSDGVTRALTLPLDSAASDDLEGIAWRDGKLYTLTSSGAVRRFTPNGTGGLTRDQNAYAIGAAPYACADLGGVNCDKNYEGLCLRPADGGEACAGYAASRVEGKLYCLTLTAGVLAVDPLRAPLTLDVPADSLSDCAFGAAGAAPQALAVATNVKNLSASYRVEESSGALTKLPTAFLFNLEAVAIDHEGALYTFSDDNTSSPSPTNKLRCENW